MSGEYETIKVGLTHEDQVLEIILANGKGNIMTKNMIEEISLCVSGESTNNPGIKAIVFKADGEHFCFGASVEEHQKDQFEELIENLRMTLSVVILANIPLFAVVRGQCLGAGMELVMLCQIFSRSSAMFGQPEIQLGVIPPMAAMVLPGIVGQLRAEHLIQTGESIDANTAHTWGLVHAVTDDPDSSLDLHLKKHILPKSASSLRFATKASRVGLFEKIRREFLNVEDIYRTMMKSHDANEGIVAFMEKRKPNFKNE
jgi:cyclohexa-1,5-dienecarbonyl-CoA hydratase